MKETYLYFRTEATDADDDARSSSAAFPASSLITMQPTSDSALTLNFSVDGVSSTVVLNLTTANTHVTAINAIANIIVSTLSGIIVIASDQTDSTSYLQGSGIASCGTIKHTSSVLYYNKITTATAVEIIDINTKTQPLTSMTLANVHSADATVQVYLLNAAGTLYYIIKDVVIPTGQTLKLEKDELDFDGDVFNLYVKLGGSTPVDVIVR